MRTRPKMSPRRPKLTTSTPSRPGSEDHPEQVEAVAGLQRIEVDAAKDVGHGDQHDRGVDRRHHACRGWCWREPPTCSGRRAEKKGSRQGLHSRGTDSSSQRTIGPRPSGERLLGGPLSSRGGSRSRWHLAVFCSVGVSAAARTRCHTTRAGSNSRQPARLSASSLAGATARPIVAWSRWGGSGPAPYDASCQIAQWPCR